MCLFSAADDDEFIYFHNIIYEMLCGISASLFSESCSVPR